ncbi:type I restriction-modification system subunit M N-terminal domain-containing protein [Nocardiopsis oceani]
MITGELKSKIDRLWDAFWSGGISNPLEVIEQITYLMFLRRLEDIQAAKERKSQRTGKPIEAPPLHGRQPGHALGRAQEALPGHPLRGDGQGRLPLAATARW